MGTMMMNVGSIVAVVVENLQANEASHVEEDSLEYWTLKFDEFENLYAAVKIRAEVVTQRERKLLESENNLIAQREELMTFEKNIQEKRDNLDGVLISIKEEELANIKFLATTYSEMDPNVVVRIFNEMEDNQVVKLLLQMKPDIIGPIFTSMIENDTQDGRNARRVAYFGNRMRLYKKKAEN